MAFTQWQTWAAENTPDVLRMKTPLTAEQLHKRHDRFGPALVQDVLLAMQNKPGLVKAYNSVYLTATDWCKRRTGDARYSGSAGPPVAVAASLATKITAQRQTKRL